MTNYRQQLTTAEEAKVWAEAHPDGEVMNSKGNIFRDLRVFPPDLAPYTVLKTGNTIIFDGTTYKEGETVNVHPCRLFGCVIKSTGYSFEILHIPDEIADKPAPKEPKTLTWDELNTVPSIVFYIDKVNNVDYLKPELTRDYLKAINILENGGNLYPTEQDAELGKARGWK